MCFLMSACQTRPVLADATESYTIRFPIEVKEERFQEDFPVRFFTYIVGYAPHVFVTCDSNVSSGPSCRLAASLVFQLALQHTMVSVAQRRPGAGLAAAMSKKARRSSSGASTCPTVPSVAASMSDESDELPSPTGRAAVSPAAPDQIFQETFGGDDAQKAMCPEDIAAEELAAAEDEEEGWGEDDGGEEMEVDEQTIKDDWAVEEDDENDKADEVQIEEEIDKPIRKRVAGSRVLKTFVAASRPLQSKLATAVVQGTGHRMDYSMLILALACQVCMRKSDDKEPPHIQSTVLDSFPCHHFHGVCWNTNHRQSPNFETCKTGHLHFVGTQL